MSALFWLLFFFFRSYFLNEWESFVFTFQIHQVARIEPSSGLILACPVYCICTSLHWSKFHVVAGALFQIDVFKSGLL